MNDKIVIERQALHTLIASAFVKGFSTAWGHFSYSTDPHKLKDACANELLDEWEQRQRKTTT